MSDVAALIADMVRSGVDPELIGRTAAALAEREPMKIVDEQAERRRAKDRERKRLRNSAESADLPSPEGSSPTPPSPKPLPSIPPSPPKGGSSPAGFSDFWTIYPNKVGKRDAEKAFAKARQRASLETIIDGLRRYAAKTDDRPWCNPATWLNQDRWEDAPAAQPARQSHSPPNEMSAAFDAIASGRSPHQDRNHERDFPTIETSYERRN